jgi:hypothetical protein
VVILGGPNDIEISRKICSDAGCVSAVTFMQESVGALGRLDLLGCLSP